MVRESDITTTLADLGVHVLAVVAKVVGCMRCRAGELLSEAGSVPTLYHQSIHGAAAVLRPLVAGVQAIGKTVTQVLGHCAIAEVRAGEEVQRAQTTALHLLIRPVRAVSVSVAKDFFWNTILRKTGTRNIA